MNKNAIKKFAIEARRALISRVGQRALKYGISDKAVGNPNDDSVNGHLLSSTEKKQRAALIGQIKEKGYEQVIEEVAYTWFNRFSALRFMEVNGYLPTRVRVFTDENNAFKPQILTEAIHMELDGLDMEKVYAYKDANDNDELYKYLLITQCNALNSVLPGMFQKIADYTELLFPDNLLREGSVVQQMIELIDQDDWKDAVQIIGWLYQYYNSEKKDDVFAALKKNIKIKKENIPAATQLFTPDWIVRYMVENSLGRLWVEGHPNDELKSQWKYYLEEAEQEPDIQAQLASIREEYKALKPEDILCIDPCSGSGHILAYMFDVLVQIYESYGVDTRTAVASIVENNIYGLDIDDRAAQLAYFSVMMKACQYDKRFLRRKVQPHVYSIVESNHVDRYAVEYFCNGDEKLKEAMDTIIKELYDAKEYGSIITVSQQDWYALYARFDEIENESVMSIYTDATLSLKTMVQVAEILSKKYDAVVTNPPYMGGIGMDSKLIEFVFAYYPNSKYDLFSVCIEKCLQMTSLRGYTAMITMESWMFLASFERMRKHIIDRCTIMNLIHMPYLGRGGTSLGISFGTQASVISKRHFRNYSAQYMCIRYYETDEEGIPLTYPVINERYVKASSDDFSIIAGSPIAYWTSSNVYKAFVTGQPLESIAEPRQGVKTLDNDRFLRFWYEVSFRTIEFHAHNQEEASASRKKWFPYNKGGEFRRWYGNNYYVVNWENDGAEMKRLAVEKYGSVTRTITNIAYFYKPGLTWSALTTAAFSIRWFDEGFIFDSKGSSMYFRNDEERAYVIGFMNSKVATHLLKILAPTLDFNVGPMKRLPIIKDVTYQNEINELVRESVALAKQDWDLNETSWDFQYHAMTKGFTTVSMAYEALVQECKNRIEILRKNEIRLNSIFIKIYNLVGELAPDVGGEEINLCCPTPKEAVVSLISYAVGCMFGRYSLFEDGIVYSGFDWESSAYREFLPDEEGILPIGNDEYFEDDIVGRFIKFIKCVYGKEFLEENLNFIASSLGGKGTTREVIRNYFINDFYKDHCSMYSVTGGGKRPIYWMFDSGKKNAFKCLIYMHRYQPDTIARIRTDYVHEQQARYRTAIAELETRIVNASTSEKVKINKQLKILNDKATEIHEYEEKIHHLADQMISIDLDDGVKKNYEIFKDVLAKIK